jgi:hypothetical protein
MLFQPLSMEFRQARRPFVLDPLLALSRHGPLLARGLTRHVELWLVPEFWRMLDNTYFWSEHPETLVPDDATAAADDARAALDAWERVRLTTDPVALDLFWIAEEPTEALLPAGCHADLVRLWRVLAQALDARARADFGKSGALMRAWRDSLALAAAVGGATILTRHGQATGQLPPLCRGAADWGLPSTEAPAGPLADLERTFLRELLVQSGLTCLLWAGLDLLMVWVLAPATPGVSGALGDDPPAHEDAASVEWRGPAEDPWRSARLFYAPL